ncbi:MAG TPA: hypothetical protein VFU63_04965 [Ktedonobacterales bacterium]|nr:hypothetical protein [Ktedonobacterales bacterium]
MPDQDNAEKPQHPNALIHAALYRGDAARAQRCRRTRRLRLSAGSKITRIAIHIPWAALDTHPGRAVII